MFPRH